MLTQQSSFCLVIKCFPPVFWCNFEYRLFFTISDKAFHVARKYANECIVENKRKLKERNAAEKAIMKRKQDARQLKGVQLLVSKSKLNPHFYVTLYYNGSPYILMLTPIFMLSYIIMDLPIFMSDISKYRGKWKCKGDVARNLILLKIEGEKESNRMSDLVS